MYSSNNFLFFVVVLSIFKMAEGGGRNIPQDSITKIVIKYYGADTTIQAARVGDHKEGVIWCQDILEPDIVNEFKNVFEWKKAKYFRVVINAKIEVFGRDTIINTYDAIISRELSYLILKKNERRYKIFPKHVIDKLIEIKYGFPLKEGWMRF